MILGIETSCDETAASVVTDDGRVLSSVVSSQADLHARFGGVVPEIASRRHLELVTPVVRDALGSASVPLDEIERVAVTQGPGLIGALLVGISAAKALAWGRGLPLVPVDHLDAHVASLYLEPSQVEPPFTCLLASGGHTLLLAVRERGRSERLGSTLDDAAGEAFDKGARLLGLGYPGGAAIDRLAQTGRRDRVRLPGGARPRSRLLVLRAEDRAALCGARARRRGGRCAKGRPRCVVPACDRARARRAPPPRSRQHRLRTCRGRRRRRGKLGAPRGPARCRFRSARAVHGQRRNGRFMREIRRAASIPSVP